MRIHRSPPPPTNPKGAVLTELLAQSAADVRELERLYAAGRLVANASHAQLREAAWERSLEARFARIRSRVLFNDSVRKHHQREDQREC